MEFLWRIFPLLRANRLYAIFNTGLKKMASIRNIFMSSSTRSTGFGSICHEPCPKTDFFLFYFRWREGVPTSISLRKCRINFFLNFHCFHGYLKFLFSSFQYFYIPTARELERTNSVTRSPIFNHFSETLSGTASIRAYGATDRFIQQSHERVNNNIKPFYCLMLANK